MLALDVDLEAVPAAGENAAFNGVADRVQVVQASLAELLAGDFGPD